MKLLALAALLPALVVPVVEATECLVPASHSTIQDAIDDSACDTISIAAGTQSESILVHRSVTISGPPEGGAVIEGSVRGYGSGTVVQLTNLLLQSGCSETLVVEGNVQVGAANLQVVQSPALPCPPGPFLFFDGFESGGTSDWSRTVP